MVFPIPTENGDTNSGIHSESSNPNLMNNTN